MNIYTFRYNPLAMLALLGGFSFLPACGDDDNATPSTTNVVTDDTDTENVEDAGGSDTTEEETTTEDNGADAGADTDESTAAVNDASSPTDEDPGATATPSEDADVVTPDGGDDLSSEPDGSTEPAGCVENDEACFSCPETPEQFLKQCTEAQCSAFDNEGRLGRYQAGEPLPEL